MALISCTDDDAVVNSSPDGTSATAAKRTVAGNKAGRDQRLIEDNIALIRDYFEGSTDLLILVGDKETIVDDMSCSSHDPELMAQKFAAGDPKFIHLSAKEGLGAGADNSKYTEAPDHIKAAMDYVNGFSSRPKEVQDAEGLVPEYFNYSDEATGTFNGKCQDLGVHRLGLLQDGQGDALEHVVSAMNSAGYGRQDWNGVPVFHLARRHVFSVAHGDIKIVTKQPRSRGINEIPVGSHELSERRILSWGVPPADGDNPTN